MENILPVFAMLFSAVAFRVQASSVCLLKQLANLIILCPMHSDEDTDIKALVSTWLKSLPGSPQDTQHIRLEGWLEDYFYSSLSWVMKANDFIIDTTLVGVALNGLSHLVGVSSKPEFVCALARGLGGNLQPATREAFTKDLFQRAHEVPPNSKRILDTYYDRDMGRLCTHQLEVILPYRAPEVCVFVWYSVVA